MLKWFKKRADEGVGEGPLRAEIATLKAEIRSLESRVNSIELDWTATFKKLQRLVGHITKSNAIDAAAAVNNRPVEVPPPAPPRPRRNVHELTRDEIAALPLLGEPRRPDKTVRQLMDEAPEDSIENSTTTI